MSHLYKFSDDKWEFRTVEKREFQNVVDTNSYSAERYRQTTNPKNPWKVNLTYSSEGKGTIATFWLDKSGTRVSDVHNVKQGSGAHYYNAFSTANKSNVRLGAENNNDSPNSYTISGYWDEETH